MITREQQLQLDLDKIDDQIQACRKIEKDIKRTHIIYGVVALIIFAVAVGLRVHLLIPLLIVISFAYGVRQATLRGAITQTLDGKKPLDLASEKRELTKLIAAEQIATIHNWKPPHH